MFGVILAGKPNNQDRRQNGGTVRGYHELLTSLAA